MMMMSKYNSFRDRTEAQKDALSNSRVAFISNSTSSTEVFHLEANDNKKVVLTRVHRENMDENILFTYVNELHPVEQGDYIKSRNRYYLVFKEYDHPAQDYYHKYKLTECNGHMKYNDTSIPAAYFGSLRRYQNIEGSNTNNSINLSEEREDPVLIVSDKEEMKKGFRFRFVGDNYIVNKVDRKSNPGIAYLSAVKHFKMEGIDTDDSTKESQEPEYDAGALIAGREKTFYTEKGYISFNTNVEIIERTNDWVKVTIPYVENLTVTTKDSELELITKEYKVVV